LGTCQVEALNVDPELWCTYQIRLHQVSRIEWMGTVSVGGSALGRMTMPAFGPVEIQVWSDNDLLSNQLQQWWQITPVLNLDFQDAEKKEFHLDDIRIFEEVNQLSNIL
jgi:hypothetical protein